jgi:hypothetical protein
MLAEAEADAVARSLPPLDDDDTRTTDEDVVEGDEEMTAEFMMRIGKNFAKQKKKNCEIVFLRLNLCSLVFHLLLPCSNFCGQYNIASALLPYFLK